MYNWDDPLGQGKKDNAEKPAVIPETTEKPTPVQATKNNVVEQNKPINHTPENKEHNARVAVEPVNADDKRVINGQTDINQLAPFKYPWAWKYFLNANKNHWTPLDLSLIHI